MRENQLESLAKNANYMEYLGRMTSSIAQSSKGIITFFAATSKKILDVGCGSGILMRTIQAVNPAAEVIGIDINQYAVDTCIEQGLDVRNCTLSDLAKQGKTFDCVIFSSVLHEFASYSEEYPFKKNPIIDALKDTYQILKKGGKVIIRDGLRVEEGKRQKRINFKFIDPNDEIWVEKFKKDFPDFVPEAVEGKNSLNADNAKEFLYTYTWGKDSWPREVKERFGILTQSEWLSLLKEQGFDIKNTMISAEEYKKYLALKMEVNDEISNLMSESTILIVAEKK